MSFADSIERFRTKPESEAQRAARLLKEAREATLLDALTLIGEQIPAPVTYIQVDHYLPGVFGYVAFTAPYVQEWRESMATLLQLIPPVKTVWFKDGCLSRAPSASLTQGKQAQALANGRASTEATAPFIIRLERLRDYPASVTVEWFGTLPGMTEPVEVTVKFERGVESEGFRQEALYKGDRYMDRDREVPYAYIPRFPFVVDQTTRFSGGGLEHGAPPTVAWWREERLDPTLSMSENWLLLTASA